MYAIVNIAGKQYKVAEGDKLKVARLSSTKSALLAPLFPRRALLHTARRIIPPSGCL